MRSVAVAIGLLIAAPAVGQSADSVRGQAVFERWCSACHAPGPQKPGTMALQAKYGGAIPGALEERRDLSPDIVRYFVRNGISIMPFFRKTEISDDDLAVLEIYLSKTQVGNRKKTR